jgi:hypothetical protein
MSKLASSANGADALVLAGMFDNTAQAEETEELLLVAPSVEYRKQGDPPKNSFDVPEWEHREAMQAYLEGIVEEEKRMIRALWGIPEA